MMKNYQKFLMFFLFLWIGTEGVKGQLLFNYDFTGLTASSNLAGQDGWTKGGSGPDATVENTTPLIYAGYNGGGGNYVQSPAGNATSSRVYKGYTATPIGTNTIFYSFLLRVSATTTTANSNYFISLGDPGTGTAYFARIAAVQGSNLSKFKIGGSKLSNTFTLSSTEFDINTTYLVVVKYVSVSGTTNDEMYIWVNPSLASEPSNSTADVVVPTTGTDPTLTGGNIGNFHWHNRNADNATVSFDGVRVAIGATSADAWTNLDASSSSTPTITVTPATLSGFTTTAGTPSASQSYTLSGSNLTPASGNITVTAPTDYEVSTDNTTFSASVNVPYSSGTLSSTTIYVRIAASAPAGSPSGNVTNAGGGASTQNVAVSGTVNPLTPFLTVTPASLSGFTTTAGTPSASQNYTLSGGNLTPASGNITVTAPTDYEVSTDNTTFLTSVSVPYSGGTLASTTIYVRIAASAPAGSPSGNVTNAGGGAPTQNVAVSGTVNTPFTPIYEPFTGTGNLNGQNGWLKHSGTANQVQRVTGNLNYPGLETATGNKIQILSTQSEDIHKGFSSLTSGAVYASFVMRVSDVSKFDVNANLGQYFMHFAEEAGIDPFTTFNFVARLYVHQGSATGTYQLGILSKGGGTPTVASVYGSSPQDLAINTNYFVVIKYDIATQTSSLFINPVPGNPEPSPTHTSTSGTSVPTDIESICVRNSNSSGIGTGDIEIDELRVGITWAQVTPPNTSPVINVNPASLNTFNTNTNTASAAQDYIVSATNLTADLVITAPAGFEIKKSSDASYASSITITPVGGVVPNTTINVRLSASNTNAKMLISSITNTSGTLTETVSVKGVVNANLGNFPDTPKDQIATPQTYTFSAAGLTENLVVSNNDSQNYSLSKDGTNFSNTLTFTPAEVNNNSVTISVRFEPKSSINGLKPVNIEHKANTLTALVSTEGKQIEPLALADELAAQVKVYPNPARNTIQIESNQLYEVELQDITGRKVSSFVSDEIVKIDNIANGLYILQFKKDNIKFAKRLIVQR